MATLPGWYDDPRPSASGVRWWDGTAWTDWISDQPDEVPPPQNATVPVVEDAPAERVAGTRSGVRTPLAVLATLVVVVLAVTAVGATVGFTGREYVRAAPSDPPSAPTRSSVVYDETARRIVVDELSMVLPGEPWDCSVAPKAISPWYERAMACSVVVHENYDGERDNYANVVVGILDTELTDTDLPSTALKAFESFRTNLYSSPTTVADLQSAAAPYGSGDQALEVTARLRYSRAKLASRYDDVRLVVVQLRSGSYAAVFTNLADDLPASTRTVLAKATGTLEVSS